MSIRTAIMIPHYCHDRQLARFLPQLAEGTLDIIIVDDGSPADVQERLRALCAPLARVELLMLPRNGGKGAASIAALRRARELGYTHAVSIDADGQHAWTDVPRLVAEAKAYPQAIVSALPEFGPDIPAARLHGRKVTNTLVRIATGSGMLRDAMCGFRIYPVQATLDLADALAWRMHMEFDVEILVRAVWQGITVRYVSSPVRYPTDGASHFRMVKDNARLTVMHINLLLGGLIRAPRLLRRALAS